MARLRTIIRMADAGMRRRAFLRRRGSPPAMAPMSLELTARPAQPQVMTKPMAVPVMRGKAVPVMARTVGKTGAMERPAMKTSTAAAAGLTVRSMKNVEMAMATEATRVTWMAGTRMRMGETPTRPTSRPRANPRERMLSARDSGMP